MGAAKALSNASQGCGDTTAATHGTEAVGWYTCKPRPLSRLATRATTSTDGMLINKPTRGGGAMPYGFNCSAGWDPATGLGTPIFQKMLAAAMKK